MKNQHLTRRQFVVTGLVSTLAITSGFEFKNEAPAVSVVKIKNNNIGAAVEEAIELLEGIKKVTQNKNRIMLKPNLVAPVPIMTTKPELIKALARLMLKEGKQVSIGEGSAASPGFNMEGEVTFNTKKSSILDRMQQFIFYELGYTDMAKSLNIPLINLHSGEMVEVDVPNGIMFDKITVHKSLIDIDICWFQYQ
jgi:uncharacterized protein (DUF362 family)